MIDFAKIDIAPERAIDSIVQQLVTIDHRNGFSFVKTPLLYPGGSTVVVRVGQEGGDYFVTDYGTGYDEAEVMGGASIYSRYAKEIAANAGIGFDSHAFFVVKASRGQLAGAVMTVANCSLRAVSVTSIKLSERRFSDATELLYRRLVKVFPPKIVARDVPIVGQSNTEWNVAAMVRGETNSTIFEPVSSHHTSVFAAVTKFHDIAGADNAPARVAVVRNKAEFKTYLALISESARVIEREASNDTFQSVVRAA
jgi:hypothetical protein